MNKLALGIILSSMIIGGAILEMEKPESFGQLLVILAIIGLLVTDWSENDD